MNGNVYAFPNVIPPKAERNSTGTVTRVFPTKPTDEELILIIAMDIRAALGRDTKYSAQKRKSHMIFLLLVLTDKEQGFIDALYREYRVPMWHYALSLCHCPTTADDVVQAAFLALLGKLDLLLTLTQWQQQAYIAVTVRRLANRHNAPKKEIALEWLEELPAGDSVELLIDRQIEFDMLHAAVHKLPEAERDVIALHYGMGLKFKDVGKLLDIRTGTARMRASRATQRLRSLLVRGGAFGE